MIKACLVIPHYNHPRTLAATVAALKPLGLRCWLVDDGSETAAREVARSVAATESWITLLTHASNTGKGAAVVSGCRAAFDAGCTHALQLDADGQHDLADAPRLLASAAGNPAAVILGEPRFDLSMPRVRRYGRYLTHFWVWCNTLSREIRDSMCGFRVYPLAALLSVVDEERPGLRMEFDTEILVRLHWRGLPIIAVPTHVIYPADGVSHFDLWRDNLRISGMHTRLFFGMLLRLPRLLARRWAHRAARSGAQA